MNAGKTFTIYRGMSVRYNGNEYVVMDYGDWGVRLFAAPDCHLVVQPFELTESTDK